MYLRQKDRYNRRKGDLYLYYHLLSSQFFHINAEVPKTLKKNRFQISIEEKWANDLFSHSAALIRLDKSCVWAASSIPNKGIPFLKISLRSVENGGGGAEKKAGRITGLFVLSHKITASLTIACLVRNCLGIWQAWLDESHKTMQLMCRSLFLAPKIGDPKGYLVQVQFRQNTSLLAGKSMDQKAINWLREDWAVLRGTRSWKRQKSSENF